MAYISLYRKYRSQNFSDLVGQEAIVQTLKNAVTYNRVNHAYLFCGPRGTGKTSVARIFAKMLNCLPQITVNPCGKCANCIAITGGTFIDVIEIDAASNTSVDNIRDIVDRVNFLPSLGRYKIYIIDEVHMLSNSAFNALLKTLEEPPANVVFILATTDPQKIPATVISRCQRLDFSRLSQKQIVEHLKYVAKQEAVSIDNDAVLLIAKKSEGCLRDALSILDQVISFSSENVVIDEVLEVIGAADNEVYISIIECIKEENAQQLIIIMEKLFYSGKNAYSVLKDILNILRSIMLLKNGMESEFEGSKEEFARLQALSDFFSLNYIITLLKKFSETLNDIRFSDEAQIILEVTLLSLIASKTIEQKNLSISESKPTVIKHEDADEELNIKNSVSGQPVIDISVKENRKQLKDSIDYEFNIISIKHHFNDILLKIKETKIALYALLAESIPEKIEGDTIVFSIKKGLKYHYDRLNQDQNIKLIGQVISDIFNQKIKVAFMMMGDNKIVENKASEIKQLDTEVAEIADIFGGKII